MPCTLTSVCKIWGHTAFTVNRALSCSCLAVYRCLSAVMAAFSYTTPDTRFRLGSSLQAGLCMYEPLIQFDHRALLGNSSHYSKIPNPIRTKYRQWWQPLVTGFAELLKEFLKWEPDYDYTRRTYLVVHSVLRQSPTGKGVGSTDFLFIEHEIMLRTKGSQENPLIFFTRH